MFVAGSIPVKFTSGSNLPFNSRVATTKGFSDMAHDKDQPSAAAHLDADAQAGVAGYAWIVLAACFLITTLTYAGSYSFGLFFKPLRNEFGWSSAATSGVFSLFMFCYCLFGIFTGWAVDRLGPRVTVIAGGICLGFGFFLSGTVHKLWQIYLTYGVLAGAGMSSVYGPVMTTASRWFRSKQGLALGIVSSGIGLGTFVGPPIFGRIIPACGWRFSYIAGGIGIGSIMVLLGTLLKKDPVHAAELDSSRGEVTFGEHRKERSSPDDWSAREIICTKPFWLYATVYVMVGFGLQMMLGHLVPYMQERYGLLSSAAAAIFSVVGIASAMGRLIMGGASDYLGSRKSLALSLLTEGVAVVLIMIAAQPWMLYPFGILLGFGYGGHAPQFPALVRQLFGIKRLGRNLGLQQIFYGAGALIGPFTAGWLFDRTGNYTPPFAIAAVALILAAWVSLSLKRPAEWDADR